MVWPLVIGAAMVVGGAISQGIGVSSRERARARALRNIKRENTRFADARLERHTALADAMEKLAARNSQSVDQFWDERNAPARAEAAQAEGARRLAGAQAGADRVSAPVGQAPVRQDAFAKAMAAREAQLAPIRDAEFRVMGAEGAQAGREVYDQGAGDRLAMALAAFEAEQRDTLLPFDIGSQERLTEHNYLLDRLGQRYQDANRSGSNALMFGSLLNLGGRALMGMGGGGSETPEKDPMDDMLKDPPPKEALVGNSGGSSNPSWQNRGR